jgi:hypothetical protein
MKLEENMLLSQFIEIELDILKTKGEMEFCKDSGWCLYSENFDLSLDSICIIGDYPDYDEDDNEIIPEYIASKGFELVYRDEAFQDVIITCYNQKNNCSIEEVFNSLMYYDQHDNFLEIK